MDQCCFPHQRRFRSSVRQSRERKVHLGYVRYLRSMKTTCLFGLLLMAISVAGICAAEIPNLVGSWAGTGVGYGEEEGYVDEANYGILTMNITEQRGRLFNGEMTFREDGAAVVEGFAGAIGSDNKTFYVAEFGSGYDVGTIPSEDELGFLDLQDGDCPLYTSDAADEG